MPLQNPDEPPPKKPVGRPRKNPVPAENPDVTTENPESIDQIQDSTNPPDENVAINITPTTTSANSAASLLQAVSYFTYLLKIFKRSTESSRNL